jgi:plasmid maintenance system antidote protein VapI
VLTFELVQIKRGPYFRVESLLGLIQQVRLRVSNGEFTERALGRLLGVSQSQTHNVLKGARRLQIQLADRILLKLGLSAMDLLTEGELETALQLRRKMVQWDREIVAGAEIDLRNTGLTLEELFARKRPAARSRTSGGLEARKSRA